MVGFAKGILVTIISSVALVLFLNISFFFPWYMTIVETTFELSQMIASDNYLTFDNYNGVYSNLKERPIFKKRNGDKQLKIEVTHENGKPAIDMSGNPASYYYDLMDENAKPYVQRGKRVSITIHAQYPLQMTLWGKEMKVADIPVEFSMNTTTLKHYKDLDFNYN